MNKKGFTVVELCVSFSLVSVIAIMLFNLIFSLKELYVSGDIKTTLLNRQGIMTKKIYDDLNGRDLRSINACGVSCLTFTYTDGKANLLIDVGANTITYDNYTMKLEKGTSIGDVEFNFIPSEQGDAVFNINIPIYSNLLEDNFGLNIVKVYDADTTSLNKKIKINDATIIANGVKLKLGKINEDWQITRNRENNDERIEIGSYPTEEGMYSIFANIFSQKANNYFKDRKEFLKSKDINKLSSLKSLEVFRSGTILDSSKDKLTGLKEKTLQGEDEDNKKTIDKINESFQKGYFELILDYPNIRSGVGSLQNYNWWIQTSNFTTSEEIVNGNNVDAVYSGDENNKWLNGLKLDNNNNNNFVIGSYRDYFKIGANEGSIGANEGLLIGPNSEYSTVPQVDIWIRVDDYIDKYALCELKLED